MDQVIIRTEKGPRVEFGDWGRGGNAVEKYSVLMAVYYKEKAENFRLAVESMLCQSAPPDEFVLVCDGPLTRALDAEVDRFCAQKPDLFRIIRLECNQGLGVALNLGLKLCRNELVARMDSDDIAVPDRMALQLAEMARNPHISVLGGQIGEFHEDFRQIHGYRTVPTESGEIRKFLKYRNPMNHMTVVLRRSSVLAVGNYRNVSGFEDYMLWASLLSEGYQMENLCQVCCRARAGAGMYARRGGISYFRNTVIMERHLLAKGLISPGEFCRNVTVRFVGTMLLPAKIRRCVFLKFLRKRELDQNRETRQYHKPTLAPLENGDFFMQSEVVTRQ